MKKKVHIPPAEGTGWWGQAADVYICGYCACEGEGEDIAWEA